MQSLVIQVPGIGVATLTLWLVASVTDRVVTLGDQPLRSTQAVGQALNARGPLKLSTGSFATWLLCTIVVLAAGCAPLTAGPKGWVTRDGSAFADLADYADCLVKARDVEVSASADGQLPFYGQTDLTLFSVCMDAHGYRLRGTQQANTRS